MWCSIVGVFVTLTLSILAAPLAADAQQAGKVPRLGVVFPAELPSPEEPHLAAFRQARRHLGYVEGQTVALESRYALGRGERFPELIAELIRLPVDLLVIGFQPAALAAKQATQALPIVFLGAPDPVGSGLVASLARPGGNLTGLSFAFLEGLAGNGWNSSRRPSQRSRMRRCSIIRALRSAQGMGKTSSWRLRPLAWRSSPSR